MGNKSRERRRERRVSVVSGRESPNNEETKVRQQTLVVVEAWGT
jgi:hypothetical protein